MSQRCRAKALSFLVVVAVIIGGYHSTVLAQRAPTGTSPSTTSVTSLLMNNWQDLVAIHHAARLYPADANPFGPRLAALHWAGDWPTNQIDQATAYFRDETSGRALTDINQFASNLYFTADGIMHVEYGAYGGETLPVSIKKLYAIVPYEPFVVLKYELLNNSNQARRFTLMELIDVNNKTEGKRGGDPGDLGEVGGGNPAGSRDPSETASGYACDVISGSSGGCPNTGSSGSSGGSGSNRGPGNSGSTGNGTPRHIQATWYPDLNAWIVDMSATNGTFVVFGAFQRMDGHTASTPPEHSFDHPELVTRFGTSPTLERRDTLAAQDLVLAMAKTVSFDRGRENSLAFFYAVQPTLETAQAAARRAQEVDSPDYWFNRTALYWDEWLLSGLQVNIPQDPALAQAYKIALISVRQSQQPEFGTFVAATNPAYEYKVWPRDAAVVAMGLDAAGYYEQAGQYWRWMASVQEDGRIEGFPKGTWYTNYGYWRAKQPIDFVQPEWDSLGLFMIGVYRHYGFLQEQDPAAARQFLEEVYPAVAAAADFIATRVDQNNPGSYGFGPLDFSIWEEQLQWATFTQVTYASGLNAARLLAQARGATAQQTAWLTAARTIEQAILRPTTALPCPGLWNAQEGYFIRGLFPGCEVDPRVDAASDLIWVFGLLPANDPRAQSHRQKVLATLVPPYGLSGFEDVAMAMDMRLNLGIARYLDDNFYYSSRYNPGGLYEADAPMPVWPQMSMYMAMAEHWLGLDDLTLARLQWYVSTTAVGYMPPGESIDWSTQQPLISTAVEPVTGMWYTLALLNYLDLYDPRLPALDANPAATTAAADESTLNTEVMGFGRAGSFD